MPHCSTMCRASRVAFWRSLVAPDVTCMGAAELVPLLQLWKEPCLHVHVQLLPSPYNGDLPVYAELGELEKGERPQPVARRPCSALLTGPLYPCNTGMATRPLAAGCAQGLACSLVGTHAATFAPLPCSLQRRAPPNNS